MAFNKYPYIDFHELNADYLLAKIASLGVDVSELRTILEDYSRTIDEKIEWIENWIDNFDDEFLIGEIQKYLAAMIFIEISDAGYIVYYIPDSWDEITFKTTGLDVTISDVDYGHLVLDY